VFKIKTIDTIENIFRYPTTGINTTGRETYRACMDEGC
jgi:hypothetical protein